MKSITLHFKTGRRGNLSLIFLNAILLFSLLPYGYSISDASGEEVLIEVAFTRIGQEYGVYFNYDRAIVAGVTVNYESGKYENIEDVLKAVFSQTDLRYEIFDGRYVAVFREDREGVESMKKMVSHIQDVIVRREKELKRSGETVIALLPSLTAHNIYSRRFIFSVSGIVTDQDGEPLVGVNVQVKGTTKGTATDLEGKFTLEDVDENSVLLFSYVGYQAQEVPVAGKTNLSIILVSDAELLEEVVVIGYGVQKKSDLTGAVSSIKGEDFQNMPVSRVDQMLQGKAPGVQVTQINGAPGSGSSIRIRGGNSIQGNNEPLYVVDGFIVGTGFDLNSINVNDIKSIEVLKDASSISIYGTRGANGVILISTKNGKSLKPGEPRISLNAYSGMQFLNTDIEFANGPELAQLANLDATNRGAALPFPDLSNVPDVDWIDQLTRNAVMNNIDLSVGGITADNLLNYYISGNYFNQDGIIRGSGIDKYIFRANFDIRPSEKFSFGLRLNIIHMKTENNKVDLRGLWYDQGLTAKAIYNEDGTFTSRNPITGSTVRNAEADVQLRVDHRYFSNILGTGYVQFEPLKGLVLKSTIGPKINYYKRNRYAPGALPERLEVLAGGLATINSDLGVDILNENTISYTTHFSSGHNFDFLGGFTWQTFSSEGLTSETEGFTNDVVQFNNLELGDPLRNVVRSDYNSWQLVSWLGRLNYNFREKYYLTAVARVDGSSRFSGSDNQYGFFPSIAAAWKLIEEPWIQNMDIFDNLKLRASYGISGSQAIGTYRTLSLLESNNMFFNGIEQPGVRNGRPSSPDLKWETTSQFDVGLESAFHGGRLAFEVDYYFKKTKDLLLDVEIPTQTGFNTRLQNLGKIQNQGLELLLNTINVSTRDFTWSTTLTLAGNRSEVLDIGDSEYINIANPTNQGGPGGRLIVGQPVPVFVGVEYLGVWQSQQEIEASGQQGQLVGGPHFKDTDGDGSVTFDDFEIIGDPEPVLYGGFMNTITWKNLSLDIFFNGSYGNDLYNSITHEAFFFREGSNAYREVLNHWSPENPDSDIPMPGTSQSLSNIKSNTKLIDDGSYLRLKNIKFTYGLPDQALRNMNWVTNMNIYFSGNNLLLFSNNKLFDPEVSRYGTDSTAIGFTRGEYPYATTMTVGLKVDF